MQASAARTSEDRDGGAERGRLDPGVDPGPGRRQGQRRERGPDDEPAADDDGDLDAEAGEEATGRRAEGPQQRQRGPLLHGEDEEEEADDDRGHDVGQQEDHAERLAHRCDARRLVGGPTAVDRLDAGDGRRDALGHRGGVGAVVDLHRDRRRHDGRCVRVGGQLHRLVGGERGEQRRRHAEADLTGGAHDLDLLAARLHHHPVAHAEPVLRSVRAGDRLAVSLGPPSLGQLDRLARPVEVVAEQRCVSQLALGLDGDRRHAQRGGVGDALDGGHLGGGVGGDHTALKVDPRVVAVHQHVGGLVADGADELGHEAAEQGLLEDDEEHQEPDGRGEQHEAALRRAASPAGRGGPIPLPQVTVEELS